MKIIIILLFFTSCLLSCSSEKQQNTNYKDNPIDSFESALPHGKSLSTTELSDEDKLTLARANGRQANVVSLDSLNDIITSDTSGLVIYSFWSLDCADCKSNNSLFQKMQYEVYDSLYLKVIYVNIDDIYPEMVNSYIRENGIIDPVFTITRDSISNWPSFLQNGWDGQLPATLIVNNEEGLRLFYQKVFSFDELQAVILPLTF